MSTEPLDEAIGRVRSMAEGAPTWDLSTHDIHALSAVLHEMDTATKARDAALEVLRPFARLGAYYKRRGIEHEVILGILPSDGPNVSLAAEHCLAALEFWQTHRPGVEP